MAHEGLHLDHHSRHFVVPPFEFFLKGGNRAAKVLYSNSALVALALTSTTSALDSAEANPEAHSSAYADSYALVSG